MGFKKEWPLTVVIPVFNAEKFISEAIQSVLNQNYNDLQIIVVDDGSTDNTRSEVEKFGSRVTYLFQENGGAAKARNTGILASNTDFISFLDADDVWHPRKLENQFYEFGKYSNLKITLGLCSIFHFELEDPHHVGYQEERPMFKLSFGSSLMRRSVFDVVGLLDEELNIGEDTDWFFRARAKKVPVSVNRHIVQYVRKHEANLTNVYPVSKLSILKVLKKAIDRNEKTDDTGIFAVNKPSGLDEVIEMWNTVSN